MREIYPAQVSSLCPKADVCFVILAINPSIKSKLFLKKKIKTPI